MLVQVNLDNGSKIRAYAINALGSYLEYLTWNRWFGNGNSTRGDRNRSISRVIRSQVNRCRRLRRRRLRNQVMLVCNVDLTKR
jgi:hypothetical protein